VSLLVFAALSAASCHPHSADRSATSFEGGARDAVAPESFDRIDGLLKQTGAIVRGTVSGISYAYGNCLGPRTMVSLTGVETLAGTPVDDHIILNTFGGKTPNGKFVTASELPRYVEGASYVLFLFNKDWRFSPVIGDLAFREETIGGRKILVDSEGYGVTGVGKLGVERNTAQLAEPALERFGSPYRSEVIDRAGDATPVAPCKGGTKCSPPSADGDAATGALLQKDRPLTVSARPAILTGIGPADARTALTAGDLVAAIGRAANQSGQQIGGRVQLRPRLGCLRVTPTSPWRRR